MIEYDASYDEICTSSELGQVIFPGLRNYSTALTLCQNVKGNLIQIETEAEQQVALDVLKTSSICSDPSVYGSEGSWIAWWDQPKEGKWVSSVNSSKALEKSSFQPWAPGEPNGETVENCAVLRRSGVL